jgi:hypothetical protein
MTTFTSEDRIEAEKRQEVMFELQKRIKEPVQLESSLEEPKANNATDRN